MGGVGDPLKWSFFLFLTPPYTPHWDDPPRPGGVTPHPPLGGVSALENPLEWRILRSQKTSKKGFKLTPQTMVHSYIIETLGHGLGTSWVGPHLYGERRAQWQLNRSGGCRDGYASLGGFVSEP